MTNKFDELKQKIASAKKEAGLAKPENNDEQGRKDMSFGWKVGIEMFSAVAVGLIIGRLADGYFETNPWLTIIFLFIGAAAGVLNIYKLAIKNQSDK